MADTIEVPTLPGLKVSEYFDYDGGIVSIPATGAWTTLFSIQETGPVYVARIRVSVYDAAAMNVLTWRLTQQGVPIPPWESQRLSNVNQETYIMRRIDGQASISLQAMNPATSPDAFDALGAIVGAKLSWKNIPQGLHR